ncbi:MAG: DNA polymerase III subunit beta [Streptococcaceae bacterium]|nr:DNA polymerase III subunit beta [Streptococcaceae bacterium]
MSLTMNRQAFLNNLRITIRAIASKTTIPILTGVKLVLTNDGLMMTGSNVDISIETFLKSDDEKANMRIHSTGGIVMDARLLNNIVAQLPQEDFTMEVMENHQVQITSGKAIFTVKGLDVENYPRLPEIDETTPLKIPVEILKQIISQTVFSVSKQESKPILTGVHVLVENGQTLKAVATDSHRMSQRVLTLPNETANFDIVIPGSSLKDVGSVFSDEEDDLDVSIADNQVLFVAGGIRYYSRLLEGNYPPTDRLIPTSYSTAVEFEVRDLQKAITRASLMSHEGHNNIVRLEITSSGVKLFGNSPEVGRFDEDLAPEKISGEELTISFNPDYMKEALSAFGDAHVEIQFISPVRPFTIRPLEDADSFIQLITPVRTA